MGHAVTRSLADWGLETLVAIVPVKPFAEAKLRLAQVLEPAARLALSRQMFEQTLDVLARARGIARIVVVSRDEHVLRLARSREVWAIREIRHGLNNALRQATAAARAQGMRAALIVPTDLPKLEPRDVEKIIELGRNPPCIVIAPAQRDQGTNGLLVHPIGLIEYAFGRFSSIEHRRRGKQAGAQIEIYRSETIVFDLDLPEDVKTLGYTMTT
ncbi:MAG TPA: 2-phospho-L-lactate guanylyltransferase [Anaerolineae bacterium]